MDAQIASLESKLNLVLGVLSRLQTENAELRTRVAGLEGERDALAERIAEARARVETLIARLPEA